MTGTKAWFPQSGAAGGLPGATMRYTIARADGRVEPLHIQAVGVRLAPGEHFELHCASGGGFGDPLDREADEVLADLAARRLDAATARDVYGVITGADGKADLAATEANRKGLRSERLAQAKPAKCPALVNDASPIRSAPGQPLYPGVVQHGPLAVAEASGAVLAMAPGNWLDGCPVLDTLLDARAGDLVMRAHLDPLSGRILFADVVFADEGPNIEISPQRWASAGG